MKSFDALINHLKEDDTVKAYQALEQVIENSPAFKQAYERMLDKQKRLVQATHAQQETPLDEKTVYEDALNELKNQVPVQQYLTLQSDVNTTVQMMFQMIEDALNAELKRK